jgi:hypothetical protein
LESRSDEKRDFEAKTGSTFQLADSVLLLLLLLPISKDGRDWQQFKKIAEKNSQHVVQQTLCFFFHLLKSHKIS